MIIYIIDDDVVMAGCIERFAKNAFSPLACKIFSNAIEAINAIDEKKPDLVFLDILLDGPDGFTFLNEMQSYNDTEKVPIVIVTSLKIKQDLSSYGVVGVLDKVTMEPEDIKKYVREYAGS